MIRTYSELKRLKTFVERYDYLKLGAVVGETTFGFDRYINQMFYRSSKWKKTRDLIIIRDEGCDLGIPGYEILDKIVIHHINPVTMEDIESGSELAFDMDNLICTSERTHLAIHFSNESMLPKPLVVRYPGDTKLW